MLIHHKRLLFFCCLLSFTLMSSTAYAHKVFIFAWTEGNTIHTQSKFSGGKWVRQGLIEAFDESGNLLDGWIVTTLD